MFTLGTLGNRTPHPDYVMQSLLYKGMPEFVSQRDVSDLS